MPTQEQIAIRLKSKTKQYDNANKGKKSKIHWIIVDIDDIRDLFCPDCLDNVVRFFGSKWIYISGKRKRVVEDRLRRIPQMLKDNCSLDEMVYKLGLYDKAHLYHYFTKLKKRYEDASSKK